MKTGSRLDPDGLRGVAKLPAGHRIVCENGVVREPESYFTLRFDRPREGMVEGLTQELSDLLEDAVRIRMVSDVPAGAFFSGVIDSWLIVALMARQSSQPGKTFSVGFRVHSSIKRSCSSPRRCQAT